VTRPAGGGGKQSITFVTVAAATALTACASTPVVEKTIEPTAGEDSAFVLSRTPQAAAARPVEKPPVHVGDQWWPFRADFLKTSEDKTRDRDGDISEKQAPGGFWDLQTSVETISIWTTFCNECHGGRRKMEDVIRMPTPGANWGRGEGLFFGVRRPYAEIFRTVYSGKIEKEGNRWKMPAWRGKLSKEQIWALIYFVEYQSGGIEGRFPPSLYPRENPEHQ
jgi:Cytochrome C oxidase, cbb3-type, subunit III